MTHKINGSIQVVPGSVPTVAKGTMYFDSTTNKMLISNDGINFEEIPMALLLRKLSGASYVMNVTNVSSWIDFFSFTTMNTVIIENVGDTDCYFKFASSVTTSTGIMLPSGARIELSDIKPSSIAAITASGTTTLSVSVLSGTVGNKTNSEILAINVTTSSGSQTFSNTTSYKDIIIINEGAINCNVNFGATATTSNLLLKAKRAIYISNALINTISAITASGTTTVKILGVY